MNRRSAAKETVECLTRGFYYSKGNKIDFISEQKYSEKNSVLISPEKGFEFTEKYINLDLKNKVGIKVLNESTVKSILKFRAKNNETLGVLNFASAKNAGGGFLNGAKAQEESLAVSSGLYGTLIHNEDYYKINRECESMMYTNYAIYSPDVVFFRNDKFEFVEDFVKASVLTLPAVNYGQVILKGEDTSKAKIVMKNRMRIALSIFAEFKNKNLILGAYGCGVFRNNPQDVAIWWHELLNDENFGGLFDEVIFAVLDNSDSKKCINAFNEIFN